MSESNAISVSGLATSHQAASMYEQLERIGKLIGDCSEATSDPATAIELKLVDTKLKALLTLFDDEQSLPVLAAQLTAKSTSSKIERLGLSKEVIRLATTGRMPITEIQAHFKLQGIDLDVHTIAKFIKAYEASSYAEKIRAKSKSIFDTSDQLENLLCIINTQLSKLNFAIDPKQQDNHRAYVGELRQLIKLAADLQRNVHQAMEQVKFQADVRYILLSICTGEQRALALERLRQYSSAQYEIGPSYSPIPYHDSNAIDRTPDL